MRKSNGTKHPKQINCYLVTAILIFSPVPNGKHRKTRIFHLEQEEGVTEGDENLKKFITNYYKGLLGNRLAVISHWWSLLRLTSRKVWQLKNEILINERFSEAKIKETIF